jgi:hypothetical protein
VWLRPEGETVREQGRAGRRGSGAGGSNGKCDGDTEGEVGGGCRGKEVQVGWMSEAAGAVGPGVRLGMDCHLTAFGDVVPGASDSV